MFKTIALDCIHGPTLKCKFNLLRKSIEITNRTKHFEIVVVRIILEKCRRTLSMPQRRQPKGNWHSTNRCAVDIYIVVALNLVAVCSSIYLSLHVLVIRTLRRNCSEYTNIWLNHVSHDRMRIYRCMVGTWMKRFGTIYGYMRPVTG